MELIFGCWDLFQITNNFLNTLGLERELFSKNKIFDKISIQIDFLKYFFNFCLES